VSEDSPVVPASPKGDLVDAYQWLAQVLTSFARAEQAIGQLCLTLDLSIKNGPLGSVNELRARLVRSKDRRCRNLEKRISRWQSLRPVRHVLAHGTVQVLYDESHIPVFVTRHLPLDKEDVTPDRVWTGAERMELLRVATNDGRSIHDQVKNLILDAKLIETLRTP
jgi:hypothetical protein